MPELPEVEVTRLGLIPAVEGQVVRGVDIRFPRLRQPIPPKLAADLVGRRILSIRRRGKYLLFDCESQQGGGWLLLHLGMSGSVRLVAPGTAVQPHEHVDIHLAAITLRYRDPRRFGVLDWIPGPLPSHPLLDHLGLEPFDPQFTGDWLYQTLRTRRAPIKPVLMDANTLVGVGNIYASESLFRARIAPSRSACRISRPRCEVLAGHIRQTLSDAIAAGGSSLRDFAHSDGSAGYFQIDCAVYGREDAPCRACGRPIRRIQQAGRASFYCPHCQH